MMASELAILLAAPSADEDDNSDADAVTWAVAGPKGLLVPLHRK